MKNSTETSRRAFLGKLAMTTIGVNAMFTKELTAYPSLLDQIETNHQFTLPMKDDKKFVPVMITPFQSDLKIDYKGLSKLVDFYQAAGVKGFFANCLSSEMYSLDAEERLALVKHVVKQVNGAVPIVATGSFGNTIAERAEFTKKMYDTGVNAVILITSHFAEANESDAILIQNLEHYLKLTGTIPLGTYECPSPYKRILTPEVFQYLLSTNRLVYHKDTTIDFDKIKVKLEMAKNSNLEFYDAHTPNTVNSLQHGARGISCIAGNFYPEIFAWMCKNVNDASQGENVNWLQSELTRADSIISTNYPLSSKYFLKKRGLPIELICRKNNNQLTVEQKQQLNVIYTDLSMWHDRLGIKVQK